MNYNKLMQLDIASEMLESISKSLTRAWVKKAKTQTEFSGGNNGGPPPRHRTTTAFADDDDQELYPWPVIGRNPSFTPHATGKYPWPLAPEKPEKKRSKVPARAYYPRARKFN